MIPAHLALLCTLLVGAAPKSRPAPLGPGEGTPALTHLVVNSGRATLVSDSGVHSVTQERTLEPFVGAGHLEVAPGSRATLSWRGLCSMELEGPASLSWQLPRAPEGLTIHTGVLNRVDLEVRKMPLQLKLPGSWRGDLNSGAYSIYSLGSGTNEFIHHAGHPVRLSWMGSANVTAPVHLVAGNSFRMEALPQVEVNGSRDVQIPSWGVASWPWGEGGIEGVPDILLDGAPSWADDAVWPWPAPGAADQDETSSAEPPQPGASESNTADDPLPEPVKWESWSWPWDANTLPGKEASITPAAPARTGDPQQADELPAAEWSPTAPAQFTPVGPAHTAKDEDSPAGSRSVAESNNREPLEQSPPITDPKNSSAGLEVSNGVDSSSTTQAGQQRNLFNPDQWRNLAETELVDKGVFRHQRGPHFKLTKNGDEGWIIQVNESAPDPYWFFSRRLDVKVFPGATLEIHSEGFLGHSTGLIRILSGRSDRVF